MSYRSVRAFILSFFFSCIKSAAYFPSDMSFLCPKIKTKKKKTVDAVTSNPRDDRPTEPKKKKKKIVPGIKKRFLKPRNPTQ